MPPQTPQTDPWVEAAKNFKAQPQGESAPTSNDDWKVWQAQGSDEQPGLIERFDKAFVEPQMAPPDESIGHHIVRGMSNFGGGAIGAVTSPVLHPIRTLAGIGGLVTEPVEAIVHPGQDEVSQMAKSFMAHPEESAESGAGGLVGGAVAGGLMSEIPKLGPYKSPVVPSAETSAERLAQAILPQEGVTPNNVRAIMREAPAVREYAMRTNNPLRTIPEGMKAAEGVAQEGLAHYKQNFSDPFSSQQISMRSVPEYQGPVSGEGRYTTLGDVEKRISDINDYLRDADRTKRSTGQMLSAHEKLGLDAEVGKLRQILYSELSKRTGVPADEIQSMREGYGGQFAIKNALESGHYGRLTRTGHMSQGGGPGIYPSKAGIIDRAITAIRGGPERIANRQFSSRMAAFDPQAPQYPVPSTMSAQTAGRAPLWQGKGIEAGQPPVMEAAPDMEGAKAIEDKIAARNAERDAAASANRAEATREFLREHEGNQAAQDLSAQRAARAANLRNMKRNLNQEAEKSFGETMRSVARLKAQRRQ